MIKPPEGHLLVVDDNKVLRMLLGRSLEQQGYNVAYAADGHQAMDLLHRQPFDMMLLDIEMPEMNGYQVLEQVISDPVLRDIPVIVTSALEELTSVVRCIEMGAEDYLFKPVNQVLLKARIGASLEKKRLRDRQAALLHQLEREMEIARRTQMSILPVKLPSRPGFDFGAMIMPARAVGGDFYDIIELESDRVGVIIGDVADKGLPAALFMALTYSLVRGEAKRASNPGQALRNTNRLLLGLNETELFVTLLYGVLDFKSGEFNYARAGHLPPVILDKDASPVPVNLGVGQPLGVFSDPLIDEGCQAIPEGGMVLLFSDGLSEAIDSQGNQFEVAGLLAVCLRQKFEPAQEICQSLWNAVITHSGDSPQQDDFTIIAIKRNQIR